MKSILPSLKESKRYIVFELDKKLSKDDAKKQIDKLFKEMVGSIGLAKADARLIGSYFNGTNGVVAVSPKFVQEMIVSLSLSEDPKINTLGVSGILNKTKKFLNK